MSLTPAFRPFRCARHPDCAFPDGGRCARSAEFANPEADCPELARVEIPGTPLVVDLVKDALRAAAALSTPAAAPGLPLPWSGRHLSIQEGWALTRVTPVRLVAVIGPYDAGKTCLLASLFLQLANGRRPGLPYRFAGCRSLHSYHRLIRQAAGFGGGADEIILDHTPKAESNDPDSFLHLALRPESADDDRVLELLLSDVPGEWFSDWAGQDDATARRRLPFLARCGAILVLTDAAALLAEGGGAHDGRNAQVLRRFLEFSRELPRKPRVWVVFTKLDKLPGFVPPDSASTRDDWGRLGRRASRTWGAIRDLRAEGLDVRVAGVSAFPGPLAEGQPYGVTELFGAVLGALEDPALPLPLPDAPRAGSPFLDLRRERA